MDTLSVTQWVHNHIAYVKKDIQPQTMITYGINYCALKANKSKKICVEILFFLLIK
ncbi:hypothetical protein A311_03766 [Escherichia coli KTE146]|nr:hypothetical protein A311_03766 [Escherichia coli KTE146]